MIVWGGYPTTASGGRYCACPAGRLYYRDSDGDGYGDPGYLNTSCDGSAPGDDVLDNTDCNDSSSSIHPGAAEICNGIDDDCNAAVDEDASGVDSDIDGVSNACDNCDFVRNPTQTDFDLDGHGDLCDVDDGLIYVLGTDDRNYVRWQGEAGFTAWNCYRGSLEALRTTGEYTQAPGSNPLAGRECGVTSLEAPDVTIPAPSEVTFSLVTGVAGGVECSLGTDGAGTQRDNPNPCP